MAQRIGKYSLQKRLGMGSYGEVWEGHCIYTQKVVAIKIARPDSIDTLLYEAKVMKYLKGSPGVTSLLGCAKLDDGRHYLVMEMLGPSLAQLKGRLTECEAKQIGKGMLETISAIHGMGMVHRDIKPDNFLFGNNGDCLHVIDYAFCKLYRDGEGALIPQSNTASPVGSPAYMSGDVHKGKDAGRKDDLESMCYVLLVLLDGTTPWHSMSFSTDLSNDEIGSMKRGISPYDIVGKARWLGAMLEYVKLLSYENTPNYRLLRDMLS